MQNNINIITENQKFTYIVEYCGKTGKSKTDWIKWSASELNLDCINLFSDDVKYMRHNNNWYNANNESSLDLCIPEITDLVKLKLHIPSYNPLLFIKNIKYMLSINTWINGYKIDFGSYLIDPLNSIANTSGPIKNGNNEYLECVELEIADPFAIVYSDDWLQFREEVCDETHGTNSTGSLLALSLYVVKECEDGYMIYPDCVGGVTNINISKPNDYMNFSISTDKLDKRTLNFEIPINSEYNNILNYLYETYGIDTIEGAPHVDESNGVFFEVMLKSNDAIVVGPRIGFCPSKSEFGKITQYVTMDNIINAPNGSEIKRFFSTWDNFIEGWNICGALVVYEDDMEILYVLSNNLPITQELFSKYVNSSEKIIDLDDMKIENYNIIHKNSEENTIKINDALSNSNSKSNIIQPVFFRVKNSETLTIHPNITENICLNLNDYKNKVERFSLQINNTIFNQIGANGYGIIFKIIGNKLPSGTTSGTYYVLNENSELVTTGKYNCIR